VSAAFGISVGTAGDVNGNGYADVIVGAFRFDNGETDEGRAYVYHGTPSGLAASSAMTVESDQAGALLGWSVGTAGDVNGDGYADVIVGAHRYSNGKHLRGARVRPLRKLLGIFATGPDWTAESDQTSARFGFFRRTAGDVNGTATPT